MFEISWSELLILALVTLVCVGPKELPALFNTIGRYVGMMRRQAAEFRKVFEDAMQEAEFERINSEVMKLKDDVTKSVSEAGALAEKSVATATATATAPLESTAPLASTEPSPAAAETSERRSPATAGSDTA